jgi:O-antigen ligase
VLFGLNIFKTYPLFGSGLGTYLILSTPYFGEELATHCDYIRMFAETGIIGGISYLILLYSIVAFTMKNLKKNDFAKISFLTMIGFLIFSLTDNGLAYSHIFWAMIGLYNGLITRDNYHVYCITSKKAVIGRMI